MSFLRLIVYLSISLLVFNCKNDRHKMPGKGVSLALSKERNQTMDSIHYTIELTIPAQKSHDIEGVETVSFSLKTTDGLLVLDFNADRNQILSVRNGNDRLDYTFINEHIVIDADDLQKGKNALTIQFVAGNLSLNRSDDYLYTLFVPDRASTCFPVFDQPDLKATYQLTLKTPQDWEAVSNGSLRLKKEEGGSAIYQFNDTKPISSYLFAFAAGKFSKDTRQAGKRTMTMYYRETDSTKVRRNREAIYTLHAKALNWLETYTAIAYPFEKFDFVLIPSFQYGGMEHPGSIFYNESSLFLDENASVNQKMARASVIAHETAHMWFGDLVTMKWFNDVWLKEVFANFMAAKIVHPNFPEINHDLRFLLAHYPNAYEVDRSAGTNPILQELENLKNAGTLYGAVIYMKAPVVMRQLERKVGAKHLQECLRDYLKTYAYGNARWDDLISILDKKSPIDLAGWSNVWVKTAGMPVYKFEFENDRLNVSQKTYSDTAVIWQQPVAIRSKTGKKYEDTTLNFNDRSAKVIGTTDSSIIFPNSDGTGYGYFQMDTASKAYFIRHYGQPGDTAFANPVFRGAMLVNLWESFLRGDGPVAEQFVTDRITLLSKEHNPLLVDYLLGNLQSAWWIFLTEESRSENQDKLEMVLWELLEKTKDKGIKTSYFRAFKSLALSKDGLDKMTALWNGKLNVKNLILSEEDKISLAYEIALKGSGDPVRILQEQLVNTQNPDRKARMKFIMPALSQDQDGRDAFFESLKKPENREKEAWVIEALSYLHHPLRSQSSVKYIRPSLYMLQEIQRTGDIFFPTRWLHSTFAGHSSQEAANTARAFLNEFPEYPFYLRNKVLQSTDLLNRAVKFKADSASL